MSIDDVGVTSVAADPPPLVLPTKLRVPTPAERCVDRGRLIATSSDSTGERRRVLITGPAGSGKTTLLAMWCHSLDPGDLVVWLTVDEADGDPVRLWSHLLHGAQSWSPGLAAQALAALQAGAPVIEVVLPLFVRDLAAVGAPVVIVLDDVHTLPEGDARTSLDVLAAHVPPGTTLACSSRLGLGTEALRWVFNEQAVHVSADDLRFSVDEIARLAEDLSAIELSPAEAGELEQATGGWAAPLRFACRQMGDHGVSTALQALGESDVEDYVVAQVLSSVEGPAASDLVLLARLGRFNRRLVADLAPQSTSLLEPPRREALGIRHLGDGWYAFHDLIREVLSKRAGSGPDAADLSAAAQWFADQGLLEEAARYAIASGDYDVAACVLNEMWPAFVETGRVETLQMLLSGIPPDQVYSSVPLLLTSAWVAGFSHDLAERDRLLEAAEAVASSPEMPDRTDSIAHASALNRCLIPSDYQTLIANADRAMSLTSAESPWMSVALMGLGTARLADGDYAACAHAYLDAASRTSPLFAVACTGGAAMACALADDLDRAAELAQQAERQRAQAGLGHVPWLVFHEVATGYVLLRRGAPDAARARFRAAEAGLTDLIEPYPLLTALLGAAECHAHLSDRESAARALDRAEQRIAVAGDIGDHFAGMVAEARLAFAAERPVAHAVSIEPLTERELAVLRLLATTQLSQAEIAEALFVSHNTVKSHTKAIYRKLRVGSRGRAAQRAGELGLVTRVLTAAG